MEQDFLLKEMPNKPVNFTPEKLTQLRKNQLNCNKSLKKKDKV